MVACDMAITFASTLRQEIDLTGHGSTMAFTKHRRRQKPRVLQWPRQVGLC